MTLTSRGPVIAISWGELFDKMTILEIKSEKLVNDVALANVRRELEGLRQALAATAIDREAVSEKIAALREVNSALWDIENAIRACEKRGEFGEAFIQLARSVYTQNDKRALIKREINSLLGSPLVEEKSYDVWA
jgi:hypothetical protein